MDVINARAEIDGVEVDYKDISFDYSGEPVKVVLTECQHLKNRPFEENLIELFTRVQGKNSSKQRMLKKLLNDINYIKRLQYDLRGAIKELLELK